MTIADKALPAQWETARLGDVVAILDSQRVPVNATERAKRPGPIPYYGATGQVGWIDDFLFDEELLLLGEDGAPFLEAGKRVAYLIRGKSWVNNHAHVLRTLGKMPVGFLRYQLNQVEYRPFVSGTTRLKLPQAPMKQIPLLIPPEAEQHRISDALDSIFSKLDAAVAALERVRANLKRYRASVLKAAVEGRLVPTEAELALKEGRDFEPASALLDRVLAERRRRWEETELARMKIVGKPPKDDRWKSKYKEPVAPRASALPELPAGWCWASIDHLSSEVRYGTSEKTNENPAGVPVLRMGNIVDGGLDFTTLKYLPKNHHEFPDLLLADSDLLFNRTNSAELVGKTAVFKSRGVPFSFASYLIRVRLLSDCSPDYISSFLNSFHGRRWIGSVVSQMVGQANVNGSKLKNCFIPLPPRAEQRRIVSEVERLSTVIQSNSVSCDLAIIRSRRLRESILKWAFEGKLVDQDPNDESATVLLERICAERAAAAPSGKSRKSNTHEVEAAK